MDTQPKNFLARDAGRRRSLAKTVANIKIGRKLALVLGCSVLLLVLVAGAGVYAVQALQAIDQAVHKESRMIVLAERMSTNLTGLETQLVKALLAVQDGSDPVARILQYRKDYTDAFEELKTRSESEDDKQILQRAVDTIAVRRALYNKVLALVKERKSQEALRLYARENAALTKTMDAALAAQQHLRSAKFDDIIARADRFAGKVKFALVVCALLAIVVVLVAGTLLAGSISKPLTLAVSRLREVAGGDVSRDLPPLYLAREDEIGLLSRAIQTVCERWREVLKGITSTIDVLSSTSSDLTTSSGQMSEGARRAAEQMHSVAAATEQMTVNVVSVAAGMEETSTNITNVAGNTEQMTSTIAEIARNSEKAREVTRAATIEAQRITEQMAELGHTANEIGKVTEVITEISSQTNLLALNATIEAARAGSAGKGFAVVATEIKQLAQQTSSATEVIKQRVSGVQGSTASSVAEMDKISQVIREVTEIVSSIAAAIEQQSAATQDITRNVGEAAAGVKDANGRISETSVATRLIAGDAVAVDREMKKMAESSEAIRQCAGSLSAIAGQLQTRPRSLKFELVSESGVKTLVVVDLFGERADFAPRFGQIPVFAAINLPGFQGFHE